ncbi:DUF6346 domain-containing protein [Lentzea sp. NBRC 102530]|uniref:DUF6346 domain-containing protein n=1 Tax=Lentzea sp. NBRC 102530 TaxID=3032201 RepID=UPI0024A44A2C|nr:DUF6346 domain-containing protein [Lentzea sp. NBRC 102530]GLY48919.1 hypothetical protein Lesp01_25750 [Lentzea sp. NBRC 102530]
MSRKSVVTVIMWLVALYSTGAAILAFNGDAASGGPVMGYAQDISCHRNWWAFGLLWDCTATVVANDGRRDHYHSDNSMLTPADIGTQVPMTTKRVRRSRTSSEEWGLAVNVEANKTGHLLGGLGIPVVAAATTYLLHRNRRSATATQPRDKPASKFQR